MVLINKERKGVSDISSEEGNLRRFSKICSLLITSKPLTSGKIETLVKNKIGLKNKKVIHRHIRLLELLRILERRKVLYIFTDMGKVFCKLLQDVDQSKSDLYPIEKIFYFERFFNPQSPTHMQLCTLLVTVSSSFTGTEKKTIVDYFRNMRKFGIWKKQVINKNILKYKEEDRISSFFSNRFRCQRKWLGYLTLLKKKELQLTNVGARVQGEISKFRDHELWENPNSSDLLRAFKGELVPFLANKEDTTLVDLFKETVRQVGREKRSSVDSIKYYIFYRSLLENEYLDDRSFDRLLRLMVERGVVASVMRGRDGSIQSVTLRR